MLYDYSTSFLNKLVKFEESQISPCFNHNRLYHFVYHGNFQIPNEVTSYHPCFNRKAMAYHRFQPIARRVFRNGMKSENSRGWFGNDYICVDD